MKNLTSLPLRPRPRWPLSTLLALLISLTPLLSLLAWNAGEKVRTWGLTPHHIDRGLDSLLLSDSLREEIDSLRQGYLTERVELRQVIRDLRDQMVDQIADGDRDALHRSRLQVRKTMKQMREGGGTYVSSVALLLDEDQIGQLLEIKEQWGMR